MKLRNAALTLSLGAMTAALSSPAVADEEAASPHSVTGSLTLTTDYIVRGLSQTGRKPAVQGTIDYGHSSGLYLGTFWSNISFPADFFERLPSTNGNSAYGGNSDISASLEIDVYGGYRGSITEEIGYDVGAIYYYYPGRYNLDTSFTPGLKKPHTGEIYAGISWNWLSAKLFYAVTDGVFMVGDARGTYYLDLSANYEIPDTGVTVVGHIGTWRWNGEMGAYKNLGLKNDVFDLVDYKVGASTDFGGFTWGAFVWGSNADELTTKGTAPVSVWGDRFGKAVGKTTLYLSVTKAF